MLNDRKAGKIRLLLKYLLKYLVAAAAIVLLLARLVFPEGSTIVRPFGNGRAVNPAGAGHATLDYP